ncbi:MAG: hypothetical protein HFJ07_17975 [Lachnospiraceae bacterium]|nr:hypothetical protein [Lachnospiraceae bacterium]
MDSRQCMISTKPFPPRQLMLIIETRLISGKNNMEKGTANATKRKHTQTGL